MNIRLEQKMVLNFFISINSIRSRFADESGRKKLYQSADIVILLVNKAMQGTYGICEYNLFGNDIGRDYRLAVLKASYGKKQFFAFSYNIFLNCRNSIVNSA